MPHLFTRKFSDSASSRTIDLAEEFLTKRLEAGASEQEMRSFARALETLYERGGVDSLNRYAPQILQEELIPQEQPNGTH